jgi:hypothetical protein
MSRIRAIFALLLLLASPAVAQNTSELPSEVSKIGNTLVGYYSKTNTTRVMVPVRTVFDNSTPEWQLAKGAQKIDLAFWYEFQGKKLNAKPLAIDFALASIAGVPARFKTEAERLFSLAIDGKEVLTGTARLSYTVPTPWVTYEDIAISVPAETNKRMIAASSSITIRIGRHTFSLTRADLQTLQDFNAALDSLVQQ